MPLQKETKPNRAEIMKVPIDGTSWRIKFFQKIYDASARLFNHFTRDRISHNRMSPWLWLVFEVGVTFLVIPET